PEDAKQVALAASAAGLDCSARLLGRVVERPESFGEDIRELRRQAVFAEIQVGREDRCRFTTGLLQEAAYRSLLRPHRQALHLRIAEAIEELHKDEIADRAETLAYHYRRSAHPVLALSHLVRAAERARSISATEEALLRLGEAREVLDAL